MTCRRPAVALAMVAMVAACGTTGENAATPHGRWVAQEIGGRAVADPSPTTLEIGADGRAFGNGGCNRYSGPARLSGAALSLGPMAATRIACAPPLMAQEQRFFDALGTVARWRMAPDGLQLLSRDGGVALRLTAAPQ